MALIQSILVIAVFSAQITLTIAPPQEPHGQTKPEVSKFLRFSGISKGPKGSLLSCLAESTWSWTRQSATSIWPAFQARTLVTRNYDSLYFFEKLEPINCRKLLEPKVQSGKATTVLTHGTCPELFKTILGFRFSTGKLSVTVNTLISPKGADLHARANDTYSCR